MSLVSVKSEGRHMKHTLLAVFLVLGLATLVSADNPTFPGFEKAMDPDTYQKAGLGKLTDAERATLNSFVRGYVATKQKDAATVAAAQAVDRAVKERKVRHRILLRAESWEPTEVPIFGRCFVWKTARFGNLRIPRSSRPRQSKIQTWLFIATCLDIKCLSKAPGSFE